MVNEESIKDSFRAVKADILKIEGEILEINEQQAVIFNELAKLTAKKKFAKKKTAKKK